MSKDRIAPCIYYVCKGQECEKGIKNVDLNKCKNCAKYRGRKGFKREDVKAKRQKDKDRHDNWRKGAW